MKAAKNNPMNLEQWQDYLLELHPKEIELGLERVRQVYDRMLQPAHQALKIVVGGTNGKGSTCAMLEAILLAAGYRVGVYSSPHLVRFNERFRIQGQPVHDELICQHLQAVEVQRGDVALTFFEFTTLAGLDLFAAADLDVWILEIGLGGRLDAVNIVDADCSILTQIAVDHQDYLGADRESIGAEKAAIFRPDTIAICTDTEPPQSVLKTAQEKGTPLWLLGRDFDYQADSYQWQYKGPNQRRAALPYPALRGNNQLPNACAALAALEALREQLVVPIQDIKQGLIQVSLPGRFQVLPGQPMVILDVAHNPHAVRSLAYNLQQIPTTGRTIAVVGMLKDKEVEAALRQLAGQIDRWHCAALPAPRGLNAEKLSTLVKAAMTAPSQPLMENLPLAQHNGRSNDEQAMSEAPRVRPRQVNRSSRPAEVLAYDSVVDAFQAAQQVSTDNDRILVFGSFFTVGPVLAVIEDQQRARVH